MRLITVQCKAEMLRIIRNPYYVFWSLLMPIMFYFIFTRVVNTGSDDLTWRAHYLMSMATFSVMGSAIMTLGIRLVQERTQGWTTFIRITPFAGIDLFFRKNVRTDDDASVFGHLYFYRRLFNQWRLFIRRSMGA